MTVATTVSRNVYQTQIGQTIFPYTFPVLNSTDIVVTFTPVGGASVVLTAGADYSVSGVGQSTGGDVTLTSGAAFGSLVIQRVVPYTQPSDYKNQGSFYPSTIERSLDRATMQIQQLVDSSNRTLRLPVTTPTSFNSELESVTASALFGVNANGDGVRTYTPQEIATTVAFSNWQYDKFTATASQTVFTLSADPGALGNLDVSIDGVVQVPVDDYTFSGTTLTLTSALSGGEIVLARYGTSAGATDGGVMTWQPAGAGAVQRTVQGKLREFVSVKDFGAAGNGSTNDSAAINAAITAVNAAGGGTVYLPAGTYVASGLVFRSGVRLLGEGVGTVIRAPAGLGSSALIGLNATTGSYTDTDITFESLVFDGNGAGLGGAQSRFTDLVALVRVTGVRVINVTVRNVGYIGMGLGSCRRVLVIGSRFTACGFDGTTVNGGSALWIASASSDIPEDVKVLGCEFHDNRWHGMHFSVRRGVVKGSTFRLNKEAHIFGSRLLPNADMTDVVIEGNTFDDITKKDISAHAIEVGGHFLVIKGNMIRNCDHGGIALTDTQNVVIEGNIITDVNRLAISAGCIDIITTGSVSNQPTNITISGNRLRAGSTSPIAAVNVGGTGAAVTILSIIGNNLNAQGTYSSGKAINIASGKATTPVIRDNWGFALDPVVSEFQANSATGNQSVTGIGFRPRRLELMAVLPSSTTQRVSSSVVPITGTASCYGWSSDVNSSSSTTKGNKAWSLFAPNNVATIVHEASFVSFDDDGFTVNITTGGSQPFVRYVAYP